MSPETVDFLNKLLFTDKAPHSKRGKIRAISDPKNELKYRLFSKTNTWCGTLNKQTTFIIFNRITATANYLVIIFFDHKIPQFI